jgi:WD40 repeat protein
MNANFLIIIKRIVSEQGEAILADPQRLKGWISDYAKDEPKAERLAFGRCIESGAYTELKNALPESRAAVKKRLAQKLHNEQGLDTALCVDALDVLEAAVWGIPEPAGSVSQSQPATKKSRKPAAASAPTVQASAAPVETVPSRSASASSEAIELPMTFSGHSGAVTSVTYSPDGRHIASKSDDNTIKIWDAQNGKEIRTFTLHRYRITSSASYSPDSRHIVAGAEDGIITIWDAANGKEIATLEGHRGEVYSVAYSPDRRRIVSGSKDKTVKIWDAETGQEIRTLKGHRGSVRVVAYNPDGRCIIAGSGHMVVKIWDAETGRTIREFSTVIGLASSVLGLAVSVTDPDGLPPVVKYSPDGRYITYAGEMMRSTVIIRDMETGRIIKTLGEESDPNITSVDYSPDGRRIAVGRRDGTVDIWDTKTGREIRKLSMESSEYIYSVAYSPDGKRIASGSGDAFFSAEDGGITIWDADV